MGGVILYLFFLPFFDFVIGHIVLYTRSSKCQNQQKDRLIVLNFFSPLLTSISYHESISYQETEEKFNPVIIKLIRICFLLVYITNIIFLCDS